MKKYLCKCGAALDFHYNREIVYYNQKTVSYKNSNQLVCPRCGENFDFSDPYQLIECYCNQIIKSSTEPYVKEERYKQLRTK